MENALFTTLLPIFFIIILSYFLKSIDFIKADFIRNLKRMTFYIFLPSLLFLKTSTSNLENLETYTSLIIATILPTLILLLISIFTFRQLRITAQHKYTAVMQGFATGNWILIGLPIALLLLNKTEMSAYYILVKAVNLIIIPIVLLLMTKTNSENKVYILKMLLSIAKNPILISIALGLIINITKIFQLPNRLIRTLTMVGEPTAVIGMILVGSSIELKDVIKDKKDVLLASLLKLIILPLITIYFCKTLNVSHSVMTAAILINSLPAAFSSLVYETELKGNPQLMSRIIAFQTIVSLFTIPFVFHYLVK